MRIRIRNLQATSDSPDSVHDDPASFAYPESAQPEALVWFPSTQSPRHPEEVAGPKRPNIATSFTEIRSATYLLSYWH